MISRDTQRILRDFWSGFGKLPLYETGFDDAIKSCGAHRADRHSEALTAMAYLKGYSDAARLACPYMGPSWRIAHALSTLSGTLLCRIEGDDLDPAAAERILHTYTVELAELCRKKDSDMGRAVGGGA